MWWYVLWCWCVNMSLNLLGAARRRFPRLAAVDGPLDFGVRLADGRRVLGDSRGWLGLALSLVAGVGAYATGHPLGVPLALLVWAGDVLGSFAKRRLAAAQGAFVPFIDHVDYIYTCGAFLLLAHLATPRELALAWLATLMLTPLVTHAAQALGLRDAAL